MFRISKDGRDWMRAVREGLDTDFDVYYFFLVAGLAAGKRNEKAPDLADLIDYYPKDFQASQRLIVAYLCSQVIKRYGVELKDKKSVHDIVKKILAPGAPSCLSSEGFAEANAYAAGGVDVLRENFPQKPRDLETFLLQFSLTIDKLLAEAN